MPDENGIVDDLENLIPESEDFSGSSGMDGMNLGFGEDPRYEQLRQEHENLLKKFGDHTEEVGKTREELAELRRENELLKLQSAYGGGYPQIPQYGYAPPLPSGYPAPQAPVQPTGYQSGQYGQYGQPPVNDMQEDRPLTVREAQEMLRRHEMEQNYAKSSAEAAYNAFFSMYPDLNREKARPYIEGAANAVDPIVDPRTGARSLTIPVRMEKIYQKLKNDFGEAILRDEYKRPVKEKVKEPVNEITGQQKPTGEVRGGQNRFTQDRGNKTQDRPMTEQERHKKRLKDIQREVQERAKNLGVTPSPIEIISS